MNDFTLPPPSSEYSAYSNYISKSSPILLNFRNYFSGKIRFLYRKKREIQVGQASPIWVLLQLQVKQVSHEMWQLVYSSQDTYLFLFISYVREFISVRFFYIKRVLYINRQDFLGNGWLQTLKSRLFYRQNFTFPWENRLFHLDVKNRALLNPHVYTRRNQV